MDPGFRNTYVEDDKVEGIKKRAVTELMSLFVEKSTPQPGTKKKLNLCVRRRKL